MQPERDTDRPTGGRHTTRDIPEAGVLAIASPARHVLDRLVATGVLGVLAAVLSTPVTIHTRSLDRARDALAATHHRTHLLLTHARYDAIHLGGGTVSFDVMIVAELIGTLMVIDVMIRRAERRPPGNQADPLTPDRPDRLDGKQP